MRPWAAVGSASTGDGLAPTVDGFGTALSDLVRCPDCGHGQLATFPTPTELDLAYRDAASEDYAVESAGQLATAEALLERIEADAGPAASRELLDLGCWLGYFSAAARGRGWRPVGVEPSGFAAARARDEHSLEVIEAPVDEVEFERGRFAVAFMGDVIEHLLEPGETLRRTRDWLADDGILAMALPDAGSRLARAMGSRWWSVIPTHLHYFTRRSIRTLLARQGYEVLSIGTAPKSFTVRYYLSRLGGYSPPLARGAVAVAESLALADRQWAPDFRDRMLVVARLATRASI